MVDNQQAQQWQWVQISRICHQNRLLLVLFLTISSTFFIFTAAAAAPIEAESDPNPTADVGAPLVNSATVLGGGALLPSTSNLVNTSLLLFPSYIVTQSTAGPVFVNEPFTITVRVTNNGAAATGGPITMASGLLTGLNFVSGSGTKGFTCEEGALNVNCTTSQSLAVGESATVNIIYNPSLLTSLLHPVLVTGGGAIAPGIALDLNIDILARPAYTVTQSTDGAVFINEPVTITVRITNTGAGDTIGDITMSSLFVGALDFESGSGTDGFTCSLGAVAVNCTTSQSLAVGESATIELVYTPNSLTSVVHPVLVTGGSSLLPGIAIGLNLDILGRPAYTVTQSTDSAVFINEPVTITVRVTNTGQADTSGDITMSSLFVGALDFESGSGTDGFTCSLGALAVNCTTSQSLAVGESATIELVYTPNSLTSVVHPVLVSGGGALLPGAALGLNLDILARPAYTVTQSTDGAVFINEPVTITVRITNTGAGDTIGDITMSSLFVGALDFESGSGTNGFTCSLGAVAVNCTTSQSLAVGESATIELVYTPNSLTSVVHPVLVTGGSSLLPGIAIGLNLDILGRPAYTVTQSTDGAVFINEPVTITVRVTNTGQADTSGDITMSSLFVGALDFESGSGTDGFTCSLGAVAVNCTTSQSLAVGESATIELVYTPNSLTSVVHPVLVSGGGALLPGIAIGLNLDILARPAYTVTQSTDGAVFINEPVTITVRVTNTGQADTSGDITMSSLFVGALDFESGSGTNGFTCSLGAVAVNCTTSQSLAVGESATIELVYTPNSLTSVVHPVLVSGGGALLPGVALGLNLDILNRPAFDISLTGPAVATQEHPFTYTIMLTNTGGSPTFGTITVVDVLPVGVEYVTGYGTNDFLCTEELLSVTCTSDTSLAIDAAATINLVVNPVGIGIVANSIGIFDADTLLLSSNVIQTTIKPLNIALDTTSETVLNANTGKTMTVRGQSVAEATVTITITDLLGAALASTVTTDDAGRFESTFDATQLADGKLNIAAIARNELDHVTAPATDSVQLDATAPLAAVMITPAQDALLQERTPTISGTAEASTTLTLLIDGETLTTTVDANGDWEVSAPPLADGPYTPVLTVTDAAGNVSPTTDGNRFTINFDGRTGVEAQVIYLPIVSK